MTFLRQRLAALSMLAALAVALGFAAFSASPASAQAPRLELPPLPHEPGVLAIRGNGDLAPDGRHLVIDPDNSVGDIHTESGELVVEDADGSFEVRAYVIGGNEARATVYVRTNDADPEEVKSSLIYIRCEEADECMSASDFHVKADAGRSWLVDIEYGAGEHGAWQLEIYREVASEVLHLPPFPAPPVHAIRGNGKTRPEDNRFMVTDSNDVHEQVDDHRLIVMDPDGEFDVVAYLEGADQAQVKVIVYADEPDGEVIKSELVTISCPDANICLQTRTITITAASGTYAFAVESVSGEDAGPWQLEVYNFVTPADDEESDSLQPAGDADDAAGEDDGSMLAADEDDAADEDSMMGDGTEDDAADEDSMMGDGTEDDAADEDSMMGDGADGDAAMDDGGMEADETESDDAMALPTGGTGGLFNQASARTTIPLAVSLAGLIAGLAIFGVALRARRNSA